jgi:hypothetical protein
MMEEIYSKSKYTKLKPKTKMISTFLVTIITLFTLTTFTAMSSNVGQVEAVTNTGNCAALDATPNGECDVDINYDGNCSPSSSNCNINLNVPNSSPGQLRLNYLLETGLYCNNVAGGSASKAFCLNNNFNNYASTVAQNGGGTMNNQFNFEGSQQIRDTDGQDRFKATNTMDQRARVNTDANPNSVVNTDGSGDNFVLKYLQDVVEPDDTTNRNLGKQLVSLEALGGGKIDTSEHSELGFSLEQRLLDIDNHDTAGSDWLTATNRASQVLGIDAQNGGVINYDTNGLSLVSQTIDDCSFATASSANPTACLNFAGDEAPLNTALTNGQRAQLFAHGVGTTVDVDNLRQLINQNIDNFENANGRDATNRVVDGQLFVAKATQGGDIDMALSDVDEQTQSLSQSIINSDGNSINEVVKPNAATFTTNTARQTTLQNLGFAGSAGQAIYIGENPTTPLDPTTATTDSVKGLVEADVDQILKQSISENDANTGTARNSGTMVMTLLAKDGPSELFVEGFDQYLTQTATCSNCANNGAVSATFEVNGDSTLTLTPGSIQGLTQTLTRDGATNTNAVISKITVTGTDATIGLNQQISNTNGGNNGISQFTGTYTAATPDTTQHCNINTNGVFTQASSVCS